MKQQMVEYCTSQFVVYQKLISYSSITFTGCWQSNSFFNGNNFFKIFLYSVNIFNKNVLFGVFNKLNPTHRLC